MIMNDEEKLKSIVEFVEKNKGKMFPIEHKFKNIGMARLIGYNKHIKLLIFRLPLNVGWIHKVMDKDDVLVYNRFELENYTYCYVNPYNYI